MTILLQKKEVHFSNPTLEELAYWVEYIRSKPEFDNFKVMIDGFDKNTIIEGGIHISEGPDIPQAN